MYKDQPNNDDLIPPKTQDDQNLISDYWLKKNVY